MEKGIGVDSSDRWRIVLLECECGLPESKYLYGKHLYSLGKTNEALEYFKRSAEGKGRHAESKFACCAVLVKDFGYRVSAPEVKSYFEDLAFSKRNTTLALVCCQKAKKWNLGGMV